MFFFSVFSGYFSQSERLLRKSTKILNAFSYSMIEERRRDPEFDSKNDLLSLFMRHKSKDFSSLATPGNSSKSPNDKFLRDVVMSFLIAGRDTTAATLTCSALVLSCNPGTHNLKHSIYKRFFFLSFVSFVRDCIVTRFLQMSKLSCCSRLMRFAAVGLKLTTNLSKATKCPPPNNCFLFFNRALFILLRQQFFALSRRIREGGAAAISACSLERKICCKRYQASRQWVLCASQIDSGLFPVCNGPDGVLVR